MNISTLAALNSPRQSTRVHKSPVKRENDPLWNEAGDLLESRGVTSDEHTLMQENIATYLAHRSGGQLNARWQGKLDRELATPYTDSEVYHHIEELEDSLQANLRELPAMPSKLHITGSFAKGRLGANSDLDGFAELPQDKVPAGFDAYERREHNPLGSNLFPMSAENPNYTRAHLLLTGKSVQVTPEQVMHDGFLRDTYEKVQANRGDKRRETHPLFEKATGLVWGEEKTAKEKRDAFESPSLQTRIQNSVLAFGGALSATPLLGPVIHSVANYFVTQQHLDFTPK